MTQDRSVLDLSLFGEGVTEGDIQGDVPSSEGEEVRPETPVSKDKTVGSPEFMEDVKTRSRELLTSLMGQTAQVRRLYPEFDLKKEMSNPGFKTLVENNVDLRTAYEVVNRSKIMPRMAEAAAREVVAKVVSNMASNRLRPSENGTLTGSAAVMTKDVSRMTREERQAIIRRVQSGEKISF